jgi:uncharacterized repeat protein (TIGR03803 family)
VVLTCAVVFAAATTRVAAKTVLQFEVIHSFDSTEGVSPSGLIEGADGQLFGLASSGGSSGDGTFFRMKRDGSVTVLHHFSFAVEGIRSPSSLVQGSDGNFYGMSARTVFQVTPLGSVHTLLAFPNASFVTLSHLLQGPDGNLYGTTSTFDGIHFGGGSVFRLTLSGQVTPLRSFGIGFSTPNSLIFGSDGKLYGTTYPGEVNSSQGYTVYHMTTAGTVEWEHEGPFLDDLVEGVDGNIYGFECCSGLSGNGFIYRVTPGGAVTVVRERNASEAGFVSLKRARDGQLYGSILTPIYHGMDPTTYSSSIVTMTLDGTTTVLQSSPVGDRIFNNVIQAGDGTFFGTTSPGAVTGSSAVFRMKATVTPTQIGDFDGDSKSDLTVFRATTGVWYVSRSSAGSGQPLAVPWGLPTDVPVPGDYDGDGKVDIAVYRPSSGMWYVLTSSSGYASYFAETWGLSNDTPVPGDYDGDGKTDLVVFRRSTGEWYILQSSTGYTTYQARQWGISTDTPVAGDYDGDGKADPGVYRAATGTWYVLLSSANYTTYIVRQWGLSTDVPVSGDYDGDGKADLAVYRPATGYWYVLWSGTGYTTYNAYQWGLATDVAVPGDYDGDGKADLAVYRPSNGYWYILTSGSHYTTYIAQPWGLSTDVPI